LSFCHAAGDLTRIASFADSRQTHASRLALRRVIASPEKESLSMSFRMTGLRPAFRCTSRFGAAFLGLLLVHPLASFAAGFAESGARAELTVTVSVEGSVYAPQEGTRDEYVRWSTKRLFEATVEMEAENPRRDSAGPATPDQEDAQAKLYADLSKQAEACKQDQACLMRIAMQMQNSPELGGGEVNQQRYQLWKSPTDASTQVKASYEDKWDTLFYVSTAETNECTLVAPKSPTELAIDDASSRASWEESSRKSVESSARSFTVEVDSETQSTFLKVVGASAGAGEQTCTITIAGRPETSRTNPYGTVLPVGEMEVPLWLKGSAPGSSIISSGSHTIDTSLHLTQLGSGFAVDATVPLKVKVEWTLKAL
jgi:hypothetical protein